MEKCGAPIYRIAYAFLLPLSSLVGPYYVVTCSLPALILNSPIATCIIPQQIRKLATRRFAHIAAEIYAPRRTQFSSTLLCGENEQWACCLVDIWIWRVYI